ncbi:MAG: 50S ribosomal protein L11 methyltransferase [Lachnospiraceae bacterium]|nr:50S ribosomal protein L11 methyltransferase [Lachnospiraceae bacterium]
MQWIKYTIHTTEEAEDLVTDALSVLGYDSVEIEDKAPISFEEQTGLFGDVVPEMPEDDHLADISFYTEDTEDTETVIAKVTAALEGLREFIDIGEGTIVTSVTEDEDWVNNWKQYFHQFTVDDILIIPSWEEVEPENDAAMVLRIDPGTAFGTGKHDTTQLAIRALRKYIKAGDAVLDIGTGSGILGIVALKSGAGKVFGTDIDTNILTAIEDNFRKNDIDPVTFPYVIGNIIDDEDTKAAARMISPEGYDICTANIIAEILKDITPAAFEQLKPGGIFITSGILDGHEGVLEEALEKAGMAIVERTRMGDWYSYVARKA